MIRLTKSHDKPDDLRSRVRLTQSQDLEYLEENSVSEAIFRRHEMLFVTIGVERVFHRALIEPQESLNGSVR